MLPTRRKDRTDRTRQCVKPTAPAAPHTLSALLMPLPVGSPACSSLARTSLHPLSVPIPVVCADASSLAPAGLRNARLKTGGQRSLVGLLAFESCRSLQICLTVQVFALHEGHPRAPPTPVGITTRAQWALPTRYCIEVSNGGHSPPHKTTSVTKTCSTASNRVPERNVVRPGRSLQNCHGLLRGGPSPPHKT